MRFSFSLVLLSLFLAVNLKAQTKASETASYFVKGQVVESSGAPVPYANAAIYATEDSALIKGTATDLEGRFRFIMESGSYYLKISYLSFKTVVVDDVKVENKNVVLEPIELRENSKLLEEVEVSAERSQMELKLDKRVFNIEKDLSNIGANAAEILDNIPSVQVDVEGNVSLRGSQNVRVLIDGKPSVITGTSTADVLRQFQGNMIEKVEVITNPSARYDAEGEVGIINIILKKEKKKGINGSIEAVAGYPDNYRTSFNLNYRTEKLNLFTSYGIGYRKSPGQGSLFQRFGGPSTDTAYVYESDSERERGGISNNVRLGTDWFINSKNTITVSGFYSYGEEENIANYEYRDLTTAGELFRLVTRDDIETEFDNKLESSINYEKTFDKEDKKFTIDLQWSESDDLEKSDIVEKDFRLNESLLQNSNNREANRTYLLQSDFIVPIKGKQLFETGVRTTLRTVDNEFIVKESREGSAFAVLPMFNNDFEYIEDIYAAYLMFGNEVDKFSYQLGLRGEYSYIQANLVKTNENNTYEYFNLFPSAFFSYKINKEQDLQLSYSRRINRPSYRYLLPFQTFSDVRNLWGGNPELQPEFTDSYELGYLKYFEKGSVFSSVYYRYRTGVIDRITIVDPEGFTVRRPVNLSRENNVGFELNGTYKWSKKLSMNGNINLYRAKTEGSFEGQRLDNEVITMNSRAVLKAEILPKVDFQTSFNYSAPQTTTQGRTKSLYFLDMSVGKDVLKGKGTLVASVRDLLNSRKRRSIVQSEDFFSESEFQWRARQFLLSFTYRINEKKKQGRGRPAEGFE